MRFWRLSVEIDSTAFGGCGMSKLIGISLILAVIATPAFAHHRHYRHTVEWLPPYGMTYLHNYGPGPLPGTIAYYDGSVQQHCQYSAAAYLGQDGQRHPCE
jgi:hypothetical protein